MMHTCTKHAPGRRPCYANHGCRCDPCTDANTAYMKRRNHDARRGLPRLIDGEHIRLHLARLGMTDLDVAHRAGVGERTIRRLREGQATTQRATALAILAVKPTGTIEHGSSHPAGTRRRLQALIALGWSTGEIGRRLGIKRQNVNAWLATDTQAVHAATVRRVRDVYDELWDATPPEGQPATRARNRAARAGWAPPAAWDDGTGPHGIDNPDATPYPWKRTERKTGRTEDLIDLIEAGATWAEITRDRTPGAIERALYRAGRGDLYLRVRPAAEPRRELWKDVA